MSKMTPDHLAEIKARVEAATPGPWKFVKDKVFSIQSDDENIGWCYRAENDDEANARDRHSGGVTMGWELCFADDPENGCTALKAKRCAGYKDCPFYKGVTYKLLSDIASDRRLRKLNGVTQKHIADTYYGGVMPWKDR